MKSISTKSYSKGALRALKLKIADIVRENFLEVTNHIFLMQSLYRLVYIYIVIFILDAITIQLVYIYIFIFILDAITIQLVYIYIVIFILDAITIQASIYI